MRKLLLLVIFCTLTSTSFAQQKTVLKDALDLISKGKNVKFTYEHQLIKNIKINFDVNEIQNHTTEYLLGKILKNTGITWNAVGKNYFTITKIREKEVANPNTRNAVSDVADGNNLVPQQNTANNFLSVNTGKKITIEGFVKEQKTGKPIAMATVQVKELGVSTMTDERGHYIFKDLIAGKSTISVQFLTMVGKEKELHLTANNTYQADFDLDENILALKEVEVVASESKSGGATASIISQKAIEHLQATSLADVLQLLPGGLATNPDFSNVNRTAIRQINANNMGSLGTAVLINGAPVSNNANLQVLNPASSGANASFSTSTGSGTDLRQISADNIESIEVIRGVPSVEYGDLTNGAIIVKTKAGQTPFQLKARVNPTLNQLWFGKGFSLGKKAGNLNADLDYTKSFSDQRFAYDAYNRLTGGLLYSNTFFKDKPLFTSISFSYAMNLDELKQDPDDAQTLTENRAKDNAFRFTSNGKWNLNQKFVRVLQYNISANYAVQKGYQQSLISNYIYPMSDAMNDTTKVGQYVPSEYLSKVWIEGKPFNLFAKITNSFYLKSGAFNHRFLMGGEWRTDANYGDGKSFDQSRPPRLSGNNSIRPFSYQDIPALNQLAFYVEDQVSGKLFNRDLQLQLGLRYDNVQPTQFLKSQIGTVLAPRINIGYQLTETLTIRGGYGITAKAPTLLYLYPQDAYFDLLNFNYYATNPAERLLIVTTRRFKSDNSDLKIATNNKAELGFDYTLFGSRLLKVTFYKEHIKNGYDFGSTLQSSTLIPVTNYVVASAPAGQPPTVIPGSSYNFFASYNQPTNNVDTKNKGIEFDLDLGRFEPIRTSFVLNGAWLNTQTINTGYYIVKRQNSGAEPTKVPIYDSGRGTEYTRASSTLRIIHNIPQARLIVTLAAQTIWTDQNKYLSYQSIPIGYVQNSDGHVVWLTEAQRNSATIINDNELNLNIAQEYYKTEKWKPLWLFNLRLTKEIGRAMSFSFFANNVLMDRPLEESSRWAGQYSRRNPRLFFGTEISIKF
jgi:outer membrane receptor for ferrienterochelin and colicin